MSTPRPASKIPLHLQGVNGVKADCDPTVYLGKAAEALHGTSGTSTIKAQQLGTPLRGGTTRAAWSIFPGVDAGPSNPQTAMPIRSTDREKWLPGSFDIDGDVDGGCDSEGSPPGTRFPARTLASDKPTAPISQCQSSLVGNQSMQEKGGASSTPNSKAIPIMTQAHSPTTTKKGKNKKGKSKRVSVEEVPDDEPDNRGGCLPMDSRYILESKTILEPKPSMPPTSFESIISYDDDEGDSTSSSIAPTPSTAPSSPPDLFEGDKARIAAAIKELQEGTVQCAQMEHKLWGPAWNSKNTTGTKGGASTRRFSVNNPDPSTPSSSQLRTNNKNANATFTNGKDTIPKPAAAIQNMKRSKAGADGKLF